MNRWMYLIPLTLLLAACGDDTPDCPGPPPTTWLGLVWAWKNGLLILAFLLIASIPTTIRRGCGWKRGSDE
jgi:hypothetical protein